nr:hypothetical protein [Ochrobactrum sp. UNC390CL2Tsu3S39]
MTKKAKGPATAPTVPSHGSIRSTGLKNMDTVIIDAPRDAIERPIDRAQRIKNTAEQLAKSVKAGNVNPDYDFTRPSTIWQCMRLRSGESLTQEEAVTAFNAAMGIDTTEHPEQRVRRLAKEISATLNDVDDYQVIIIYPSAAADYPVQVCLDGEFSDLLEAVIRLRKERRDGAVTCE